jgi:hypothetical protein
MDSIFIRDFMEGDILLFKVDLSDPNTEWISKAIALLTNSDVSHAALYMGESTISDEGLSGLACHAISDADPAAGPDHTSSADKEPRPVYVRRLTTPECKKPVIDAAKQYILCDEPYDKPALVLLGLILLYRDCPLHLLPVDLVTRILAMAASIIDECINRICHPGKKPMVCSQYVFQCYVSAGAEYQLSIHNDCSSNRLPLIDHVHNVVKNSPEEWQQISFHAERYDETIGSEFVKALQAADLSQPASVSSAEIDKDLIRSVLHFSDKLHSLWHGSDNTMSTIEKLSSNMDAKSLFVTPADLKLCNNLKDEGSALIYRASENL